MSHSQNPTAAIMIIGNELLNGKTRDENVHYLAVRLHELGIDLLEVRFIPDVEQTIIDVVNTLRDQFTYVFTTGGIGPTHDDITSAAIAKAFNRQIVRNTEASERMERYFPKGKLNEARLKMADMPEDVVLIDNEVSIAPGFQIENVYVLAGIPTIMQSMFESLVDKLSLGLPRKTVIIFGAVVEGYIAKELQQIQLDHPSVEIGSYPRWGSNSEHGVEIVMKGSDETETLTTAMAVETMFVSHGAEYHRVVS